ncbi:hypothetical protein [Thalassotalea fusca]
MNSPNLTLYNEKESKVSCETVDKTNRQQMKMIRIEAWLQRISNKLDLSYVVRQK